MGRSIRQLRNWARRNSKSAMVKRMSPGMGKTRAEKVAKGLKKWSGGKK